MSTEALPREGRLCGRADTPYVAGADTDDRTGEVYQYARRHGEIRPTASEEIGIALGMTGSEVRSAVLRLLELRLLGTDDGVRDRLVPADPWSAESRLVWSAERAMYRQRGIADHLRERLDAINGGRLGGDGAVGTIDGLEDTMEIRGLLKLAADNCRDELLMLVPEDRDVEWDALFEACGTVLDRGAVVRLILPHRSRAAFAARARARRLADAGADLRTIGRVSHAAVVFDRSVAVLFDSSGVGGLPAARRVREEVTVRFLLTVFDQLWEGGAPFGPDDAGYAEPVTDDLQRSIARLMAEGFTDEVVARRLGMSVRTCRRHIAALLGRLGAVSRFQAGVIAARHLSDDALPA